MLNIIVEVGHWLSYLVCNLKGVKELFHINKFKSCAKLW